jgi:hypothetical protein
MGGNANSSDEIIFTDAGAEFRRTLGALSVRTQVVVSPEDDIELRRSPWYTMAVYRER